jgi:hypothetical protein
MGNSNGGTFKKHVYKSGTVYEGEWKGNVREGKGKFTWTDGMFYEGA